MRINEWFDQGACLNCRTRLNAFSAKHDSAPSEGSIMICLECSHVMEWTGGRLAELSDEAIKDVAADPDVLDALQRAAWFRRQKSGKPQ